MYNCELCLFSTADRKEYEGHLQEHLEEVGEQKAEVEQEEDDEEETQTEEEQVPEDVAPVSGDGETPSGDIAGQLFQAFAGQVATVVKQVGRATPMAQLERSFLNLTSAILTQATVESELEPDEIMETYLQIRSRLMAREKR